MSTEALYHVTGLSRTYRDGGAEVIALDRVDLRIHAGQRWGIVGESGSGKSTLIRLLAALDQPTAGTVTFQGQEIHHRRERSLGFLRSAVQMVFQDPRSSLNPRMTVGDIITEPLRSAMLRRRRDVPSNIAARLAEVVEQVGLPADSSARYPHEFSGGQRQRIALARALAPRPQVLIADEPVSALDVSVRSQILNLLNDLVASDQLTLIFVSHDLAVVRYLCDQIAVMQRGQIVENGTRAEVYEGARHPYTQKLLAAIPVLPVVPD